MNESVNNAVPRETKIQSVLTLKSWGKGGGGGGRTPFKGPHRETPPKKGWGFHQLKFMKWEGNLSEKRPKRANTRIWL